MCEQQCSDTEECRYDKANCEYKCVLPLSNGSIDDEEYSYSAGVKLIASCVLTALTAAINF